MNSPSAIPVYREINELHAAARLPLRTDQPAFHLFSDDDLQRTARRLSLPPHRRGFFCVSYLTSDDDAGGGDRLIAAAPEHVLTGADLANEHGRPAESFTLLFKAELLAHQLAAPGNEFPFFFLPTPLRLSLDAAQRARLRPQFARLRAVAEANHPYRLKQLAALTTALLYDCRLVYEQDAANPVDHASCRELVCRFEDLVRQHFATRRTVEDYARLLHVSADHLSAEVKAHTGRNAREIIAEQVVTEARHLLNYTELTISEIADRLAFSEPTHFTRFFRRQVGVSPREFRRAGGHEVAERELLVAAGR